MSNLRFYTPEVWTGTEEGTTTTYFVDSNGKLIGDPILGAHPDKYKELMDNSVVIQKMMTGPMFFISDHCIDIYISHTVEDIGFYIRIILL